MTNLSGDYLIAVQEECPTCGAIQNIECYTRSGLIAQKPHRARVRMASYIMQNVQSPIDEENDIGAESQ